MTRLARIYRILFDAYGPQGWWPIPSMAGRRGFDPGGYHPGDPLQPRTAAGRFEVALGAVLTQNTAWTNAEKALTSLLGAGVGTPEAVCSCDGSRLAALIRSSGHFNRKAGTLKAMAGIFLGRRVPSREALLALRGIGPETADSILLYAFRQPVFVVDAYTRRLLARIGLAEGAGSDEAVQAFFHDSLPRRPELFSEYHALIVTHAKRFCRALPVCGGCPVRDCAHRRSAKSRA